MGNKDKIYGIETVKVTGRGDRPDRVSRVVGHLDYLKQYFNYTLEIGRSWNSKIKYINDIKTIKSLESNLQKSFEEKESACYDRTSVSVVAPSAEELQECLCRG